MMQNNMLEKIADRLTLAGVRRAFFYFFILLYLAICPVVLFYAFGFIIKPKEQKLVQTGLVSINTYPSGASIYLGPSRYVQRSPAILSELLPGRYNVRISLNQYRPWSQSFYVSAGKAVLFDKILLLPNVLSPRTINRESFLNIVPLEGSPHCILVKGRTFKDNYIFDGSEIRPEPLASRIFLYAGARLQDIATIQDNPLAVLTLILQKESKYLLLQADKDSLTDISTIIVRPPERFFLDPGDTSTLYSLYKDQIDMIKPQAGAVYPEYLERARGFGARDKKLYVLSHEGILLRMNQDRSNPEILLSDASVSASIFAPKGFYEIRPLPAGTFVFLGEDGQLATNHLPHRICDSGCRGISFDDQHDRILFWTKNDIGAVEFLHDNPEGDPVSNGSIVQYVSRTGGDIKQCFWVYDGSHILFRDANKVFLAELMPQGLPHIEFLIQVKNNTDIFYSEETGTLYYLDAKIEGLQALNILPENAPAALPQTETEKSSASDKKP